MNSKILVYTIIYRNSIFCFKKGGPSKSNTIYNLYNILKMKEKDDNE